MKRTLVLAILDGWGLGKFDESNPIHVAQPQSISYIQKYFPYGALKSHGISVGLPWGESGNSEVGHLTIGSGKVIYQHYPKISMAIDDGSFFSNPQLKNAFTHAKKMGSAVHLVGLLTQGSVHAHLSHLLALIDMAKKESCENLFLHLFTDGKDSPPRKSLKLIAQVEDSLKKSGVGQIASITGRLYAMNRDGSWDRTQKAYNTLLGKVKATNSPKEIIESAYKKNLNDQYIEPSLINPPRPIQSGDAVIFFNFREDSIRQISEPFLNPKFNQFRAEKLENLAVVTMTRYHEKFESNTAFLNESVTTPLSKILADNGKNQLRITETEKYAHVTYFFNGLKEEPFPNEYRVIIPSIKTIRPSENPEMRASEITDRVVTSLSEGAFDFILINYANPDILAHTGNFEATLKAIKIVDQQLNRLLKSVLDQGHTLILTSDHGNAEVVLNPKTGEPETGHNPNPVPLYLVGSELQRKSKNTNPYAEIPTIGMLPDIAPTILEIMNLPIPTEMTGESLLNQLT